MSIYIPRIHMKCDEQYINYIMNFFMIGVVNRVDFREIEGNEDYCSAFVHFIHYMDNTYVADMLALLEQGHSQRLQISPSEYWILLKNNNPVPETRLNIHQLAENARLLEERVLSLESQAFKQEQENFDLRTQMAAQKQQMERLEQMVYQMRAEMVEDYYIRQQQMGHEDVKGKQDIPLDSVPAQQHMQQPDGQLDQELETQQQPQQQQPHLPPPPPDNLGRQSRIRIEIVLRTRASSMSSRWNMRT